MQKDDMPPKFFYP